jgi:hypothetical protein
MVAVWVTVLVSVLGEAVLGGTVVVPVSVLGGGAVSVTVSVGAPLPPLWWRGGTAAVVSSRGRESGRGRTGHQLDHCVCR